MTPAELLEALENGHVHATFESQRRYAVTATEAHSPILFITVPDDSAECCVSDDAYIIEEDMHEHPLTLTEIHAATQALQRSL
jgi:hypothetical protein